MADYETPIFVCNYPKEAKAFYMQENPADPRTVCATTAWPRRGTVRSSAGRSVRTTTTSCCTGSTKSSCLVDAYGSYLDLRKYGTFVHSGFGIGLSGRSPGLRARRTSASAFRSPA